MIKLTEIIKMHGFEPLYSYSQLHYDILERHESKKIQDSQLYKAIVKLTEKAYPTQENRYEKRWIDFYIPLKRRGYLILFPLGIIMYDQKYFLSLRESQIEVCKGKAKDDFYQGLIEQTLEFTRVIKKDPDIIKKSIPNDIRTGRILGKYVMEKLLPADKKEEILKLYREHIKKVKSLTSISLNDYLNTTAICYKAAFGSKTNNLTAEQMYRKWADGRDCGLLEINDKESKEDFSKWFVTKSSCGGHPYEIVYSFIDHGIDLFPPTPNNPYFFIHVTNYDYAGYYLAMVKALIKGKISFEAYDLEKVLNYVAGDSYFTVNTCGEHFIYYDSGDRNLLKYIEWDEPNSVRWKYFPDNELAEVQI